MSRYLYAFMPNQSGLDELDAHGGENLRISLDNQTAIVEFEPFVGGQEQSVPSELAGKLKSLSESIAIMKAELSRWEVPDD
jgi:hypothetical protein